MTDLSYFQDPDTGEILPRPTTITKQKLDTIVTKFAGVNDAKVEKAAEMYLAGQQWDWYEKEYLPYLEQLAKDEAWNAANVGITVVGTQPVWVVDDPDAGEGHYETEDVYASARALPTEPPRPPVLTVAQYLLAGVDYRTLRQARYIRELSPEGNFERTIGDVLDALISAVADNDKTKLDALSAKVKKIKTEVPKP